MGTITVYISEVLQRDLDREAEERSMSLAKYIGFIAASWHGNRGELLEQENEKLRRANTQMQKTLLEKGE